MAGFLPIKNQIVAVLQGVSSLQAVYGKEEKNLAGYPAACVSAKEHTSSFYSIGPQGSNEEIYQHWIRIYFRTDEENDPDYEDVLESVADQVMTALRQNITLNGACLYSLPISSVWLNGQKVSPVRYVEIIEQSTIQQSR